MCKGASFRNVRGCLNDYFPYSENRVCNILGIKYPIVEGGMAWAGESTLAAAVSNSGALGTLGAGSLDGEQLRKEIAVIRKLTDKPFAINLLVISPYFEECLKVIFEEKIDNVILGGGNPGSTLKWLKDEGKTVLCVVSSDNLAKMLEREGADIIIAEGSESGGHIGNVSSLVLIPSIKESISIPVISAGGISDGKTAAATIILGAEGIQMGTRFLASNEAKIHENYKNMILKSGICDTIVTGRALGHPVRVIKNRFSKRILNLELIDKLAAEKELIGSLGKAVASGDRKNGSFMAGQSAGRIEDILSVEEIISTISKDIEKILNIDEVFKDE